MCDQCGAILYGSEQKTSYYSLSGFMDYKSIDSNGKTKTIYITSKENKEIPLCFCDSSCLIEFIESKVTEYRGIKNDDQKFLIGRKKNY